jgi:hypothetical protein
MPLDEMVGCERQGNVNLTPAVPRQGDLEVRLHGVEENAARETLMEMSTAFGEALKFVGPHKRTRGLDAGARVDAASDDREPVSVPWIEGIGELASTNPQTEPGQLNPGFTKGLELRYAASVCSTYRRSAANARLAERASETMPRPARLAATALYRAARHQG